MLSVFCENNLHHERFHLQESIVSCKVLSRLLLETKLLFEIHVDLFHFVQSSTKKFLQLTLCNEMSHFSHVFSYRCHNMSFTLANSLEKRYLCKHGHGGFYVELCCSDCTN